MFSLKDKAEKSETIISYGREIKIDAENPLIYIKEYLCPPGTILHPVLTEDGAYCVVEKHIVLVLGSKDRASTEKKWHVTSEDQLQESMKTGSPLADPYTEETFWPAADEEGNAVTSIEKETLLKCADQRGETTLLRLGNEVIDLKTFNEAIQSINKAAPGEKIAQIARDTKIRIKLAALKAFQENSVPTAIRNIEANSELRNPEIKPKLTGIVFDSIDEVAIAIRIFGSKGFKDRMENEIAAIAKGHPDEIKGTLQDIIKKYSESTVPGAFIDELIEEIRRTESCDRFFEYEALGTNFFKKPLGLKKVGEKYILNIGSEEDTDAMAKIMDKHRGIERIDLTFKPEKIPGTTWVAFDVEKLLAGFEEKSSTLNIAKDLTREIAAPYRSVIKTDGSVASMRLSLDSGLPYALSSITSGPKRVGTRVFMDTAETKIPADPTFFLCLFPVDDTPVLDPDAIEAFKNLAHQIQQGMIRAQPLHEV